MLGTYLASRSSNLDCEVLIVGSGAGGSSVADVLTKAGLDVLMLEEGPVAYHKKTTNQIVEMIPRLWRSGGLTLALGAPPISYVEGRCVGGGTEINAAIIQKVPDNLLDIWADKYKIKEFGSEELKPYYDRAFDAVNASLAHGELGEPSNIIKKGAASLGWKISSLERAQDNCIGNNRCTTGCPSGAKQSMSITLLKDSIHRGMRLISQCRVSNVSSNKHGVFTVAHALDENNKKYKIKIKSKFIFICCGAVHTPVLLQRSGISKKAGKTFQLHPTFKVIAKFPQIVNADKNRLPLFAVTEFMPDIRLGGSVFTPAFFSTSLADDWISRKKLMKEYSYCGLYYAMIRGTGRGSVRVMPFLKDPIVTYKLSDNDWKNMKNAIKHLSKLMFSAGASEIYPSIRNHPAWTSLEEVHGEIDNASFQKKMINLMTIHLFSSCPMGEIEGQSVTNSFGKVKNTNNVFVADASLIPESPGVNPQATVMALAYRTAEKFLIHQGYR
jgi:choline dehydrogenase-like flavoprotein